VPRIRPQILQPLSSFAYSLRRNQTGPQLVGCVALGQAKPRSLDVSFLGQELSVRCSVTTAWTWTFEAGNGP
jgi:hypothetical protein